MNDEKTKVDKLKQDKDVREALEETTGKDVVKKAPVQSKEKLRLGTYAILFTAFGVAFFLLRNHYFDAVWFSEQLKGLFLAGVIIVPVLIVLDLIKIFLIKPLHDGVARYNLKRITNLLGGIAIFLIALTIFVNNWYTAVVSFGLISLILGFALQTPITSFIGWIYILVRRPYKIGDRIKIGEASGDVIGVGYLDTTLWEFGGEHLSTKNHPSGRLIKFPNSKVLNTTVFNYSWSLFPYIWDDIKFQIAYQSDLEYVARVMRETAEEDVGEVMMERIRVYRELLAQTPIDELEVNEHPVVVFRVGENTWIEAIVRYLVEPRRAGSTKTRLIKKMLGRLNAEPEKVMFPKGDAR